MFMQHWLEKLCDSSRMLETHLGQRRGGSFKEPLGMVRRLLLMRTMVGAPASLCVCSEMMGRRRLAGIGRVMWTSSACVFYLGWCRHSLCRLWFTKRWLHRCVARNLACVFCRIWFVGKVTASICNNRGNEGRWRTRR